MAYKNDVKPQKGDAVLGAVEGAPARGKVVRYDEKSDRILFDCLGAAVKHSSGQMIQGAPKQHDAPAADFELIYRKEASK